MNQPVPMITPILKGTILLSSMSAVPDAHSSGGVRSGIDVARPGGGQADRKGETNGLPGLDRSGQDRAEGMENIENRINPTRDRQSQQLRWPCDSFPICQPSTA